MRPRAKAAATALAAALLTAPVPAAAAPPSPPAAPQIDWKPCFDPAHLPQVLPPGGDRLQCGSFRAPLDWNHPEDGRTATIAVTRLSPPDGSRHRALFTNPGGPGAAGRSVPLALLAEDRTRLLDTFDVYGIDVRGVGDSTRATCSAPPPQPPAPPPDMRDRSPQGVRRALDNAAGTARFCQQGSGELGRYLTTEQTVRDLDLLRQLVHQPHVDYWGTSAGTWLGAQYAAHFPQHTGQFALDSNLDVTGTWQRALAEQPRGTERAFRERYLPWVAAHDATYHLGSTPEQVSASYERVRARLARQPAQDPQLGRLGPEGLDGQLRYAVAARSEFDSSAQLLHRLDTAPSNAGAQKPTPHDPAPQDPAHQSKGPYNGPGTPTATALTLNATPFAIRCNDTAFHGSEREVVARSDEQGRHYPLAGWAQISQPCLSWQRPPVQLPEPTGAGAPPALLLQGTHDPLTPIEGAERTHAQLAGSRMVVAEGESDHVAYGDGKPCVDEVTDAYLIDGALPGRDLTCPAAPLPEPGEPPEPSLLDRVLEFTEQLGPLPR